MAFLINYSIIVMYLIGKILQSLRFIIVIFNFMFNFNLLIGNSISYFVISLFINKLVVVIDINFIIIRKVITKIIIMVNYFRINLTNYCCFIIDFIIMN